MTMASFPMTNRVNVCYDTTSAPVLQGDFKISFNSLLFLRHFLSSGSGHYLWPLPKLSMIVITSPLMLFSVVR